MPINPLRRKLATSQALIGPLLQEIPNSPELVEFLVAAGFDYVISDGEHGGVSTETCRELVRAAESMGGCALARVPNADPARILAFLDNGVQGIVLAHCRGAAEAEALVRAVKYPRAAFGGPRVAVARRATATVVQAATMSRRRTRRRCASG